MVVGAPTSNDVTESVFTLPGNGTFVLRVNAMHSISFRNLCCVLMDMSYAEGKVVHVVNTQLRGIREWCMHEDIHVLCVYKLHDRTTYEVRDMQYTR
jgi:hypothetical protein